MGNNFIYKEATLTDFHQAFEEYGWIIYQKALSQKLISEILGGFEHAYQQRFDSQTNSNLNTKMIETLHHLLEPNNFGIQFLSLLFCDREIRDYLGGNYILNGVNGTINCRNNKSYVQNIYRDLNSGDAKTIIHMVVLLDDFTIFNGATHFLSGSHKVNSKPDEKHFLAFSEQAVAKRGSIILFNPKVWHAGGKNYTRKNQRYLKLAFTKPFVKQQFDYPKYLGELYGETLDMDLRQIIGYNIIISNNLEENFQPEKVPPFQHLLGDVIL